MATAENGTHRANPLFWAVGLAVALVGLVVMAVGIIVTIDYFQQPDPLEGDGVAEFADAFVLIAQGTVVLTIGRYVWRGARRRGGRDRFGRLLIISGHILLGVAFTEATPVIGGLYLGIAEGQAESITYDFILTFACWALPGAALAAIGVKMAGERILMTASAGA